MTERIQFDVSRLDPTDERPIDPGIVCVILWTLFPDAEIIETEGVFEVQGDHPLLATIARRLEHMGWWSRTIPIRATGRVYVVRADAP